MNMCLKKHSRSMIRVDWNARAVYTTLFVTQALITVSSAAFKAVDLSANTGSLLSPLSFLF